MKFEIRNSETCKPLFFSDASRPWIVFTKDRSFNQVVGRYQTEAQAKRRARVLNRRQEA